MFKNSLIAALMVCSFAAKAQSIKVFSSCRELPRIINFQREAANGGIFERYTIGSSCPAKQMPINRLVVGHYQFDDLPIRANEEFLVMVQEKGVTTYRQILTQKDNSFFVSLAAGQDLTIIISEKLACNCQSSSKE